VGITTAAAAGIRADMVEIVMTLDPGMVAIADVGADTEGKGSNIIKQPIQISSELKYGYRWVPRMEAHGRVDTEKEASSIERARIFFTNVNCTGTDTEHGIPIAARNEEI